METKTFGDKKITIRKLSKSDFRNAKKFQEYINSLVREEAKLSMNKEVSLKEEKDFLNSALVGIKNKKRVYIFAESDGKIVGVSNIEQKKGRMSHIGLFGITIRDGYRGLGLGKALMQEVIKAARKDLSPQPKIIELEVYTNNKPAIGLYKKLGFKTVAKIPHRMNWKGKLIGVYVMLKYFNK